MIRVKGEATTSLTQGVVGWAFGQQQTADLVIQALNMALITRKPLARITAAIRLWPALIPWSASSAWMRGTP